MSAGPATPADARPVSLQEGWEACAGEIMHATTLRDFYALKARRARANANTEDADLDQRTADGWARRAQVFERVAGLIDLAMRDAGIMERLKALAAEKRAAEEAFAIDTLGAALKEAGERK